MFFYLKKLIAFFFEPLSICFIIFGFGLYHLYKKEPDLKKAKRFVTAGAATLFFFSCPAISHFLIAPFDSGYAPYLEKKDGDEFEYIFVLGHGAAVDEEMPATSCLTREGLARVAEGIRLQRIFPDAKLIFSGWGRKEEISYSEMAARAAVELGVDPDSIIQIPNARDTIEESTLGKEIVGESRFLLVTSSVHMPRSYGIFKKLGLDAVPSPSDFINKGSWRLSMPSSGGIYRSERAIYEGLGNTWAWITGRK